MSIPSISQENIAWLTAFAVLIQDEKFGGVQGGNYGEENFLCNRVCRLQRPCHGMGAGTRLCPPRSVWSAGRTLGWWARRDGMVPVAYQPGPMQPGPMQPGPMQPGPAPQPMADAVAMGESVLHGQPKHSVMGVLRRFPVYPAAECERGLRRACSARHQPDTPPTGEPTPIQVAQPGVASIDFHPGFASALPRRWMSATPWWRPLRTTRARTKTVFRRTGLPDEIRSMVSHPSIWSSERSRATGCRPTPTIK